MKVIFMGTPDFALPSLEMLCEKHDVIAVFCQPDKASGRGNKITYGPIKEYALSHNIPVYQPQTFKNGACKELIESMHADIAVVAAYGKILPRYALDAPKYGCINVHGSLLPKYRGAAPIQYAILNGDSQTGVTIMQMSDGIDDGDIISQKAVNIGEYETAGELFDRLSVEGARLLIDTVDNIERGTAVRTPQNSAESTHVSMLDKSMGRLDFNKPAKIIKQTVYGLNPWPSAYIETKTGLIKIHRLLIGSDCNTEPGTVVDVSKRGIEVCCGDGNTVIITEIQRVGKKKMDAYSFSLGLKIGPNMSIYDI